LWRQLIIQDNCYERCKPSITRWLTLLGTIITQFALGSVYTWSLFNSSLSDKLDEPVSQVAFSFGLLSLGLALSSSVAGKLAGTFWREARHHGVRVLLGLGFFLTAHSNSLMMLWLSAGCWWAGGRRRLSADAVELREVVPGT
jgi:MFS family permease